MAKQNRELCPICLMAIRRQAGIDSCEHLYCDCCIRKWAQVTLCTHSANKFALYVRRGLDPSSEQLRAFESQGSPEEKKGVETFRKLSLKKITPRRPHSWMKTIRWRRRFFRSYSAGERPGRATVSFWACSAGSKACWKNYDLINR